MAAYRRLCPLLETRSAISGAVDTHDTSEADGLAAVEVVVDEVAGEHGAVDTHDASEADGLAAVEVVVVDVAGTAVARLLAMGLLVLVALGSLRSCANGAQVMLAEIALGLLST